MLPIGDVFETTKKYGDGTTVTREQSTRTNRDNTSTQDSIIGTNYPDGSNQRTRYDSISNGETTRQRNASCNPSSHD